MPKARFPGRYQWRSGTIEVEDWGTRTLADTLLGSQGYGVTEVKKYEKGTLVIDFVDPKTREVIGEGGARRPGSGANLRGRCEGGREAVAKILEDSRRLRPLSGPNPAR